MPLAKRKWVKMMPRSQKIVTRPKLYAGGCFQRIKGKHPDALYFALPEIFAPNQSRDNDDSGHPMPEIDVISGNQVLDHVIAFDADHPPEILEPDQHNLGFRLIRVLDVFKTLLGPRESRRGRSYVKILEDVVHTAFPWIKSWYMVFAKLTSDNGDYIRIDMLLSFVEAVAMLGITPDATNLLLSIRDQNASKQDPGQPALIHYAPRINQVTNPNANSCSEECSDERDPAGRMPNNTWANAPREDTERGETVLRMLR
jgi:hypothetical protein